jgi:salicylate hydroxylase
MRIFEKARNPRTTRITNDSTSMRSIFDLPDGERQRERDRQLTTMEPFVGYPNRWADPEFQQWLLGYDAETDVLKAWQMYQWRSYL